MRTSTSMACASDRDATPAVSNSSTTASGVTMPRTWVVATAVYGTWQIHGLGPLHRAQRRRVAPSGRAVVSRQTIGTAGAGAVGGRRARRALPAHVGAALPRSHVLRRPGPDV